MGLALWRYDEHGVALEAGHHSTRFGRRQNALLCVREDTNNAVLNPFFHNDAEFWTPDTDLTVTRKTPKGLPFGTGAVEIGRVDGATYPVMLTQKHVAASPDYVSQSLIDWTSPPNGTRQAYLSVYVKGPVGAKVLLVFQEEAVSGWFGSSEYTITSREWERAVVQFSPAAPQVGTDQWDYSIGIGLTDTYLGPVQLNAPQFTWNALKRPQFVWDGIGAVLEAESLVGSDQYHRSSGSGLASYTGAYTPVPDDIIRPVGGLSFWLYCEALDLEENYIFNFKSDLGGDLPLLGHGTVNDIMSANIYREPANDQCYLILSLASPSGADWDDVVFVLGRQHSELNKNWSHFFIQWTDGVYRLAYDGVPIQPSNTPHVGGPKRSPRYLSLGGVTEHEARRNISGLLEGFTVYDRNYTVAEIRDVYAHGDNLVTGAIAHVSLHDDIVLEVGECVAFEGPGDYRIEVNGYAPGTTAGQPTVRFEAGREAEGPYITQARFPKIIEPITFQIMNNDTAHSLPQKMSQVNRVLQRSGTGQQLVLQYSPRGSQRNLRAKVQNAYLTIPVEWTSVAQVAGILKGLKIDVERDNYTGGRRSLGKVFIPQATPMEADSDEEFGPTILPPVDGNLPAPLNLMVVHSRDKYGEQMLEAQPHSFMLALRRRKSLDQPIFYFGVEGLDFTGAEADTVMNVNATRPDGWDIEVEHTNLELTNVGQFYRLGAWTVANSADSANSHTESLGLRSNHGNYRAFVMARSTLFGPVEVGLKIGDAEYSGEIIHSEWHFVDMGTVNIPGKSVVRPQFAEWSLPEVELRAARMSSVNDEVHIAGVVFLPVDDGLVQLYSSATGYGLSFAGPGGTISNTSLLAGYSAGLVLSASVPTEVRAMVMEPAFAAPNLYGAWDYHPSSLRVHIEYIPTYTGIGDE